MKTLLTILAALGLIIAISSYKKCYDSTLKNGTFKKLGVTVAGCDGDFVLGNYSIEAWKVFLESQGYACTSNNEEREASGSDNKKTLENDNYTCLGQ